jgi:hypothetical protein
MARTSIIVMLAAIVMLAVPAASAAPSRSNDGTGMTQSSMPASDRDSGTRTPASRMGSGKAAPPATTISPEAAIKRENEILDRKLGSICRGC